MADTNVKILVTAIDNASNVLKNIGKNIENSLGKQTQTNVSSLTGAMQGTAGTFATLAIGAGAVGVALAGVGMVVSKVTNAFRGVMDAAGNSDQVMAQTNAVLRSTGAISGASAKQVLEIARSLSQLTPVEDEAIQAAENMLLTFTAIGHETLPQATEAVLDMATAMNGGAIPSQEQLVNESIRLGKALQDPILGITALRRVGVNFSDQQKEVIKNLVNTGQGLKAQQLILAELTREFGGSGAASLGTYGGAMKNLHNEINNVKEGLGQALSPAIQMVAGQLAGAFAGAATFLQGKLAGLQAMVLRLTGAFMGMFGLVGGMVKLAFSVATGQLDKIPGIVKETSGNLFANIAETNQRIENVWVQAADKQKDAANKGANGAVIAQSLASKKIQKAMEDETATYERELKKRNEAFEESLGDMVRAHIDKKNRLVQDLADENSEFKESMDGRIRDFKEKMDDMVASYKEKVADIKQSQADENDSFAEAMQDRTDRFNESMESMVESHEDKVLNLQRELSRERRTGDETNRAKLLNLQQELVDENTEYVKAVAKKEAQQAKEVAKAEAAHAKKLAKLTQDLTDEDALYTKNRLKNIADEEEQTKKLQKEHDKRVAATQKDLDAETVILKRHQAEVDTVKNQVVEDDITRLKKQHERENSEALLQHNQKMADAKNQGLAEGDEYGKGLLGGLNPKFEELVKKAKKAGQEMGENLVSQVETSAKKAGESLFTGFVSGAVNLVKEAVHKGLSVGLAGPAGQMYEMWRQGKIPGMQTGGIVPGPIGQPVPIMAHGQEEVVPFGKGRSGGGSSGAVNLNVYVGLYAGSEIEKRRIAEALYNQLVLIAGSQNKSVKDVFGR